MDTQSPSATSPVPLTMPVAGGEDALRATLAAALEALETERAARQRAEAALQERDRRLDEVERLASLGSWEQVLAEPLDQQPVRWSAEQLRIHGLDESTAPATFAEFLERVHPDDRARVREECDRLLATRIPFSFPYRVIRPDGTCREMNALGKLLPDPAGTGQRMVGISQDVTERNAADRALRESEARFRDLFEQFPHSVKVYAPDGTVVRVNAAYERLWGLSLEQVARFNPLRDVGMAEIGALVRRAFAGETVVLPAVLFDPREYTPDVVPPEGMVWPRWVQASYFPIRGADGEVLEVVAVHQDVTEGRQAEEALRASEASYRTIFESSSDAIFLTDPETGRVVDANLRACAMSDATLDELRADAGRFIWNGPPPFTAETARDQIRRAMEGEAQRFEWMWIHPSTAQERWSDVRLQRVTIRGEDRIHSQDPDNRQQRVSERLDARVGDALEPLPSRRIREDHPGELFPIQGAVAQHLGQDRLDQRGRVAERSRGGEQRAELALLTDWPEEDPEAWIAIAEAAIAQIADLLHPAHDIVQHGRIADGGNRHFHALLHRDGVGAGGDALARQDFALAGRLAEAPAGQRRASGHQQPVERDDRRSRRHRRAMRLQRLGEPVPGSEPCHAGNGGALFGLIAQCGDIVADRR